MKKVVYLLYVLALIFLALFIFHDEWGVQEETAKIFYYIALGIFGIGVIRVVYLIWRK